MTGGLTGEVATTVPDIGSQPILSRARQRINGARNGGARNGVASEHLTFELRGKNRGQAANLDRKQSCRTRRTGGFFQEWILCQKMMPDPRWIQCRTSSPRDAAAAGPIGHLSATFRQAVEMERGVALRCGRSHAITPAPPVCIASCSSPCCELASSTVSSCGLLGFLVPSPLSVKSGQPHIHTFDIPMRFGSSACFVLWKRAYVRAKGKSEASSCCQTFSGRDLRSKAENRRRGAPID